jgi:PPOX class probable F420-dependent enzyme
VCYALLGHEAGIAIDEKPKSSAWPQRLRNLAREPRCTLLVDQWSEDWSRLAWVRVEAEGHTETRGEIRPDLLTALRARYPQYRTMELESRPLIVLRTVRVVSWRARS